MRKYLPVDSVDHRPFCSAPVVTWWQGRHEEMARCRDCAAIKPLPSESEPEPEVARRPRGRWRCREHLDVEVTWRGTGCHLCKGGAR